MSETAAAILAHRRLQGEVAALLPQSLRPQSFAEAFVLQQQVAALLPSAIAGWKCALPTVDANGEKQVVAPLYQAEVCRSPAAICPIWPSVLPQSKGLARVEPELAFVFHKDLPARGQGAPYSEAEINAAIGGVHLALELIQSRFLADSGALYFDQLADGLFNQGLYLGPAVAVRDVDLKQFLLSIYAGDELLLQQQAQHPNGDAKAALYWLVNFLSAQGIGLKAGQAVITGSYAGVLDLPIGSQIQFEFGQLGSFSLQFQPGKP
ncbi:fumarylacetoacetate hydrolase family protein [Rheinheimera sp. 4Y26]|uniref:fumarylacetoacetate hydrolase family protein n=1 Tax=Rheinheimera sp. 4Y26 TaxID=2977811 RepID=UPI0021B14436|nr:fumarylacetoacetate hydrolase family protein [Rheinheimera sp. 4Y26]MCT6698288.1 fumarylacetoacetate hydrolase family protein [Rheinheimera sp. 4Y26]